jgi:RTX calcium-binding nonapeptide repeat (4 copies)/Putative metal-binding motif
MKRRFLAVAALVLVVGSAVASSAGATVVYTCVSASDPTLHRVCVSGIDGVATNVSVDAFSDAQGLHVRVSPGPAGDVLTAGGSCQLAGPAVVCPNSGLERLSLYGRELGDVLDLSGLPAESFLGGLPSYMEGRDGNDLLIGSASNDTIRGLNGNDRIEGGAGAGTLYGGDGDDVISYRGASRVSGGPGRDLVTFAGATAPVAVTLGVSGGDGVAPSYGQIASDVEDIVGGSSADTISTSASLAVANHFAGGPGNDQIIPGGGIDLVEGGDGDDTIAVRDGLADQVDCGAGNDLVMVDPVDVTPNCERRSLARVDSDGDRYPSDIDCNDHNPRQHPLARDIPQNGVDEDCDGRDAPFPVIPSSIHITYGDRQDVTLLSIDGGVLRSTRIQVSCRGRRCPFRKRTKQVGRGRSKVKLTRWLRGKRLTGSTLQVRVIAPERLGKVRIDRIRRSGIQAPIRRCLDPRRASDPRGTLNLRLRPRRPRFPGECSG